MQINEAITQYLPCIPVSGIKHFIIETPVTGLQSFKQSDKSKVDVLHFQTFCRAFCSSLGLVYFNPLFTFSFSPPLSSKMAAEWKRVRSDLEKSIELKRFVEHVTFAIREQLDSSYAGGESLAKLIEEKIQETLSGEEVVYTALQDKVAHEVESHFLDSKTPKKDAILHTAAVMLAENPSLRSMLTVFINTPLHIPLRKALWSIILKDQVSKEQFLMINEGMERNKSLLDPELLSRCTSILEGKRLAEFSKHKQLSFEYCAILSFWKDKSKAELTTATCLLCLPFLNLYKDELRQSSKEVNWPIVSVVAEMFTSYMRILPLNMRNVRQNSQVSGNHN